MRSRSLILAMALVATAATLSLTIASCDGSSTDPANPGIKNGKGKGGQVLTGGNDLVAVSRSGLGGSDLSFDQLEATLTVDGFQGTSGLSSSVSLNPGNVWSQDIAGDWPAAGNGGLQLQSLDGPAETSRLDILQATPFGDIDVEPTFHGGAAPNFTIVLRLCAGGTVRIVLPNGTRIRINRPLDDCCRWLRQHRFIVERGTGRCIWQLLWNRCCCWRIFINGVWYEVDGVDFAEGQDGGAYPYHNFSEIRVAPLAGGLADNRLRVTSEFVANVP